MRGFKLIDFATVGFGIGIPTAAMVAIYLSDAGESVETSYYSAVSAVIPLVLIALLTTISGRRELLRTSGRRLSKSEREGAGLEARIADARKQVDHSTAAVDEQEKGIRELELDILRTGADPETREKVAALRKRVDEMRAALAAQDLPEVPDFSKAREEVWAVVRRGQRLGAVLVVLAVFLAAAGESAALVALAFNERTDVVFALTVQSLLGLLFLFVFFEVDEWFRSA